MDGLVYSGLILTIRSIVGKQDESYTFYLTDLNKW